MSVDPLAQLGREALKRALLLIEEMAADVPTLYDGWAENIAELHTTLDALGPLPPIRRVVEAAVALVPWLEAIRLGERWLPDWACRECVPHSDVLKDGFRCRYHEAIAQTRGQSPATTTGTRY